MNLTKVEEIRGDLTRTDLHVYAVDDEYGLVKADRMARSLSPELARTQRLLSAHGLVEMRIGQKHLLTTAAKTTEEDIDDNVIDGNSPLREAEAAGECG